MVKKDLGVSSAKELDGATVCIQTGTTTELNLADFFKANNITYTPVTVQDDSEGAAPVSGRRLRRLHHRRLGSGRRARHHGRPGKPHHPARDHLEGTAGPGGRHGDNQWGDIVRWTFNALLIAEEKGITKANIEEVAASTTDPEVKRLLGLKATWARWSAWTTLGFKAAIAAGGNYGEIFEANIGDRHPDRPGPRPERAVDPGRPAIRGSVPLILTRARLTGRPRLQDEPEFQTARRGAPHNRRGAGQERDTGGIHGIANDADAAPKDGFRLSMLIYDTRYPRDHHPGGRAGAVPAVRRLAGDNTIQNLAAKGKDISFGFLWARRL
jgi:hypothetical protein